LPAAQQLARRLRVTGRERMLLGVAAAFHDLGFIDVVEGHEAVSVAMARRALPGFGFGAADLDLIAGLIMATKLPQAPQTPLEEIMSDADLDVLGRPDFPQSSEALRQETDNLGTRFSNAAWAQRQLSFMRDHHYFTTAARALREEGKAANMSWLERTFLSAG
jgi:predicted metal-dependent HD superfamily phosphohydrolase